MDKEQRADEEENSGKYHKFNSIEELIADLHDGHFIVCPWCRLVFYPKSATDVHCV